MPGARMPATIPPWKGMRRMRHSAQRVSGKRGWLSER